MYNKLFWTKYCFRVLHMSTVIILSGNIIWRYLFKLKKQEADSVIIWIVSLVMILAGFINTIILDPKTKMKKNATQWIGTTHTKLISSLFIMTPIFEYIVDDDIALSIRFYFCGLWILVSPFLRFYRELWTEHHRMKPQSLQMVDFEQIS